MNTATLMMSCGVLLAGVSLTASAAMTREEYRQQRELISQRYDANLALCDGKPRASRPLCATEAAADRDMLYADLESGYRNTTDANMAAARAKAEALYSVEQAKCNGLANKQGCLHDALASRNHDLADIDANRSRYEVLQASQVVMITEPPEDAPPPAPAAMPAPMAAPQQAPAMAPEPVPEPVPAPQRCDTLSGTAKDICLFDAKPRP
ncbi:hypothetical protein ABWL39_12525 [Chitinivorax sp. PXF-14]|uniref:hypothetical protein n=1 Tax=Chitinivorax sp. PXF-14 TaxID=3230488 RepID=UPI0034661483